MIAVVGEAEVGDAVGGGVGELSAGGRRRNSGHRGISRSSGGVIVRVLKFEELESSGGGYRLIVMCESG